MNNKDQIVRDILERVCEIQNVPQEVRSLTIKVRNGKLETNDVDYWK